MPDQREIAVDKDRMLEIFERRLKRERAAREQAESITERITRKLYERNRDLELISEISSIGLRSSSALSGFDEVLSLLCSQLLWDCAGLELLNHEASQHLRGAMQSVSSSEDFAPVNRLLGHPIGLVSEVLLHGAPCWVSDLRSDERFADLQWREQLLSLGVSSLCALPIYFDNSVQAVLLLASRSMRDRDNPQLELLEQITTQLGHMMARWLTQLELIRARVDAESALQARNEFLAVISHEMRTPMNGVLGMARLALSKAPGEVLERYLKTIVSSAERMMEMVSMILDMANIKAGRAKLEEFSFIVRQRVENAVMPFEALARRKQVAFSYTIADDVPELLQGDAVRFGQIISHIVGNAVKFTEVGAVTVDVDVLSIEEGQCRLRVQVKDTGIGIAEDKQAQIFDEFRQADGSLTRHYEGAGLGLALSKSLTGMMGGSIQLESSPGQGSTFTIILTFGQV